MGWRGTIRSVSAAMKPAERNAERRRKQDAKFNMIEESSDAVSDWQNLVHELVSIHINPTESIDWYKISTQSEPLPPIRNSEQETKARAKLNLFKPGKLDFLRGGTEKRRRALEDAVSVATHADQEFYRVSCEIYQRKLEEHNSDVALANLILAGDANARKSVIAEMQSLSTEGIIGSSISFAISENHVHAIANVHGEETIPSVRRKQLQSGRLSETKMPVGEFNELFQDYVCSVALRVAGDLFAILPIDEVYVTCAPEMLNTTTGKKEETPVLSVRFMRETFLKLNLAGIDPSDSLSNFVHVMDFKRTKGFARITPLKPIQGE
jgi:hypothetical protein